ncbi:helix-turn-helix domain-containing protein [Photorhabdus laumondii subsp. laumondii]|uniref:Photorhabdus luminescens subsp. laumondii TTO1 complete genome segment 16/17 n=2 Tax=Photorhabdus laumondii subsp. laumondii TaxID=141679 RepID=Q7MZ32_PHOLL|nr:MULTISPECIES: helix-turn-helix transcriptional regulator [Photorhabdus]AWK44006.1 transcriptional regulator [Photorhabdus laumondii subsp. laumondii]AXG44685.1 XRE family transcriptional regulator [Photorhabdus laumondii subsp. laumondii]AXG49321.1 XRE family transcriptional regulator [Photorhabdus laumondii subsp. laumondii]MCC8383951.1 helix-turn-helix transcriptional regulator [Photorhabdus laumondii]MCC8387630.1 helix-turn-helix transcriptional regulator [Photorhabdus laumondii]
MLPHRLKAARLKAGLSQERLGILAGIDEATASARMNQYERGIHTPDFELACRLASVLHVPACYFYAVEDDLAEMILGYSDSQEKSTL